MKRFIKFFAALLFAAITFQAAAQQYSCSATTANLYTVAAKSGLSLRSMPSLISEKILAVPYGRTISVCTDDIAGQEVIEGVEGQWVRAFYSDKSGYMFNGFLEKQADISVINTEDWYEDTFTDGREYYGLYSANGNSFDPEFRIEKCDFVQDTIQMIEGDPYVSLALQESQSPLFLFSGIEVNKKDAIPGRAFDQKFLFPGESVFLSTDRATYYVYAKGNVLLNKDPEANSPFSMIRNYELRVKRVMDGEVVDKSIYKMDLPSWFGDEYGGGVHLQWIGDLDGDGELDMLLSKTSEDSCWEVVFMLSSKAEPGQYFRQVSSYTECGGC